MITSYRCTGPLGPGQWRPLTSVTINTMGSRGPGRTPEVRKGVVQSTALGLTPHLRVLPELSSVCIGLQGGGCGDIFTSSPC